METEKRYKAVATKYWLLCKPSFTESDIIWLKSTGCDIELKQFDPIEIAVFGKVQHMIPRLPEIRITTTCPKQESMLQLKYSEFLIHTGTSYEGIDLASHRGQTTG